MSTFFNIKKQSIYLDVTAEKKVIRPLARTPEGKWVYSIPSCKERGEDNKEKVIRYFRTVDADFSQYMRNNPDPLWDKLADDDKYKQSGEVQHFPMRPVHYLPVWSYSDNDVKIVRQGNQFYEEMGKFHDIGGDITLSDWMCWTEGQNRRKSYKTSRAPEQSAFQCPVDQGTLGQKIQALMEQALKDLLPFPDEQALVNYIHAIAPAPGAGNALPAAQTQQPTHQIPGYTPGGQTPATLGAAPALPPAQGVPAPGTQVQVGTPGVAPQTTTAPAQPAPTAPATWDPNATAQPATTAPTTAPAPAAPAAWTPPAGPPAQNTAPAAPAAWTPPAAPAATQNEVPNAPVTSAPVHAPPAPVAPATPAPAAAAPAPTPQPQFTPQPAAAAPAPAGNDPASIVLDFGKHKGKTLGQVQAEDASYLNFLKGNKKELAPAIDAMLGGAAPAPSAAPAAPAPSMAGNGGDEVARQNLVQYISDSMTHIPDFQGAGIAQHMMPFIKNTIGTPNFSDAPMDQLMTLKAAVEAKAAEAGVQLGQ